MKKQGYGMVYFFLGCGLFIAGIITLVAWADGGLQGNSLFIILGFNAIVLAITAYAAYSGYKGVKTTNSLIDNNEFVMMDIYHFDRETEFNTIHIALKYVYEGTTYYFNLSCEDKSELTTEQFLELIKEYDAFQLPVYVKFPKYKNFIADVSYFEKKIGKEIGLEICGYGSGTGNGDLTLFPENVKR